ncbi:tail fiber domain-containing protein [Ruminiclostridium herbifermentans]|uniref:tail fiber domain-containing protein n=1 Tax=Ruminiclostridium herbifermentans TaxID=2488810 RepID=UPI001FD49433|nr:tail fiber domain-containing protein [Ruminiclostridium herbifermentans]
MVTNPCGSWKYYTRTIVGNGGDRLLLKSPGGIYVDGNFYITSSKEYKENIHELSQKEAQNAIEALEPVEYNFKGDKKKTTIGFIAENVPDSLASYNKTAISPMEIIAVLVKEVKDQERAINELDKKIIKISKNKRKKNKN